MVIMDTHATKATYNSMFPDLFIVISFPGVHVVRLFGISMLCLSCTVYTTNVCVRASSVSGVLVGFLDFVLAPCLKKHTL